MLKNFLFELTCYYISVKKDENGFYEKNILYLFVILMLILFFGYFFCQKPTVSILIPTYNREIFLPRFLDNMLAQTYRDFEIVFIDDGSTDKTEKILSDYQKKDKRIRIIQNEKNLGLIGAGNRGLEAVRGKYIARIDDDELAYPTWIEDSLNFLEKNPSVDVVYPFRENQPNHIRKTAVLQSRPTLPGILFGNVIGNSGTIFKKEFLDKHHIRYNPERKSAEDYDLWVQFLKKGAIIRRIPKTLISMYTDSKHSPEYYQHMSKNTALTSRDILQFFAKGYSDQHISRCKLFKYIYTTPAKARLFNSNELLLETNNICAINHLKKKDVTWQFEHFHWVDGIILEPNQKRFKRLNGSTGTILKIDGNKITVKWDSWGIETFICDKNKFCMIDTFYQLF